MKTKMPEVCVGYLIQNKEGEIALFHSPRWKQYWNFPGGHIEFGETAEEAVRREIFEELGVEVGEISLINYIENINDPEYHQKAHLVSLVFLCEAKTEDFKIDNQEITKYKWFDKNELLEMDNQILKGLVGKILE